MKKLFTLAAAVLASLTMWAQTTLATFEVTLTSDPTTTYASYSDDDANYTCYKVGSSSSSNFYKASNDKYYLKLTGDDAYVQITLKDGSFAADDIVYYALNHSQKKTGIGFKFKKSSATTTVDMTAAGTEIIGSYTLKAADIEDDGSIKMLRANSNTFVNRIYVTRAAVETNPVTEVTVSGESTASIGYPSEYTASTDVKADAYKWFVNDVEQEGATAKTFTLTPAASDTYSIVCKARNEFNATDEWIASDAKVVKAYTLHGELIKATHTGKTTATVTGLVGGTADKSTQSDGKFGSNGHYFGITLASGSFQAGDTLNVNIGTVANQGTITLYQEKEGTNVLYNTEAIGVVGDNKFVLPAALDGKSTFYIVRPSDANKWNAVVNFISVIRPMAVKSTVASLTAVAINDVAISAENLASLLSAKTLILEDKYVNAPVVKFTKHVVTTYEDDSQKEIDEVIEKTSTVASAGVWGASATIGEITYSVYTVKQLSYVVTYKDGEETLGTENVSQNGSPANYSQYQSKQLSSFVAWYSDAALENAVTIGEAVITKDTTFYGKFNFVYAQSVNIEKAVLDNGTSYNVMAHMGGIGYASNISNVLDSLNDTKTKRNYAYLGLKVKQNGAMLDFRLAAGSTVKIKFGNVAATPQASINGAAYEAITITENVYSYTAEADVYFSIKTADGNAVVFQQIMINEDIQTVVLPALYTVTYNAGAGECEVASVGTQFAGDVVVLPAVTPAEGYEFKGWFDAVTEGELIGVAGDNYTPTADITLYAQYDAEEPAGCDWASLEWIGCEGGLGYDSQFKICLGDPAPSVVNIQNPGWATAPGLYITFKTADFGEISLDAEDYDIQGAGMLLHVEAFYAKETEVVIQCKQPGEPNFTDFVFTIYNAKGTTTALDNTNAEVKAVKRIVNGQLIITIDDKDYNVVGQIIR